MTYKILADFMVCLHFIWILFLFFGAFWGSRKRLVRLIHLSGLALAFLIQAWDGYCPLTHVEIYLRARHDPALAYGGSFLIYYLEKIIYLEVSHTLILIATIILCGINFLFYFNYFRRRRPS
jgi:hypothetical protein